MKIDANAADPGADVYYEDTFRWILEDHLTYFRNSKDIKSIPIDAQQLDVFKFDFFGLLRKMRYEPQYFWIIMRVNNIDCPQDFPSDLQSILVPDLREVDKILTAHKAVKQINN
jgi:hypothetical protein